MSTADNTEVEVAEAAATAHRPYRKTRRPRPPRPLCCLQCSSSTSQSLGRRARCGADAELALTQDRVDPRDVAANGLEPPVALQLPGRGLEPEVEQLLLALLQLSGQCVVVHLVQLVGDNRLGSDSHQLPPPSRTTNRHFIGSLCMARRMASRARGSSTPANSNMIRPGLTLAIHHSGDPDGFR